MGDTTATTAMGMAAMSDAPERIWTASTKGKCHVGFDTPSMNYTNEYIRADLMAELVEALETARDYVHDASRGALRYRSKADISNMAGEDLVMIDAALAKIKGQTK